MKGRVVLIVVIVIALGLGIGLLVRHNQAVQEAQKSQENITSLSNNVVRTQGKVDELTRVNSTLQTNLVERTRELETTSNKFTDVSAALAKTEAEAQAAAEQAAAEMAKRDSKIAELQGQNDEMTKRMLELNNSLGSLEKQIAVTEKKLAASEGDREFLLRELKRLQGEKAELEKQFNDLAMLREQVRRLKDELSISQRLDWIRRGIYGSTQKGAGAAALMDKTRPATGTNANADLNVELQQNGGVKVQSGNTATNSPPK